MERKTVSAIMLTLLLIGMLALAFNIQPVEASGTIYIRADGSVEPSTANITSTDNVTYYFTGNINESIVVERDNIVVDGAGYTVQGTGGGTGIDLTGRSNVTIKNMEIKSFSISSGIWLGYGSSYNTISGNTITNNGRGIHLEYPYYSSNNKIYHNNFMDNTHQVVTHDGYMNIWDDGYPSGGNYWSDYLDVDMFSGPYQNETGSDGIGDTPYVIDANNRDNYPLVFEHELAVSLKTPRYIQLGRSTLLRAMVYNRGSSNETDVELQLLINGSRVADVTIPELTSGSSHMLSYIWTPTVEGTYNVTAYVPPVPDEAVVANNVAMRDVSVVTTFVGTYISVEPPQSTVAVGATFTVNITVNDVTDLYSWQIKLYFDNAILNRTAAWLPDDHVFSYTSMYVFMVNPRPGDPDWGAGYIIVAGTLLGDEPPFTGSGTLCQIQFRGIALGSCILQFGLGVEDTYLVTYEDYTPIDIPFDVADGLIVVVELEGDLNHDGAVDMRDIALAAAAFGSYPGHPRWNPIADINKDNKVDMRDIVTVAKNFGKTV